MQLMINTDTDSPDALAALAAILVSEAARRGQLAFNTDPQPLASDDVEDDLDPVLLGAASPDAPHAPIVAAAVATLVPPPPAGVIAAPTLAELDSQGQPWNAELHAATRTKIKDGTWKKKKGAGGKPAAATEPVAPMVPPPPGSPAAATQAVVVAPPVPPPPAAAAPVVPPPPAAGGATFVSIMSKVNEAIAAGKITHARVVELCRAAGAADLTLLVAMPHVCDSVNALLDAELFGK